MTRSKHNKILFIAVLLSLFVILLSCFDFRYYQDISGGAHSYILFEDDSFIAGHIGGCLPWGICQIE